MTAIVWFRQDLRLEDNPALAEAAAAGDILPVYIRDTSPAAGAWGLGGASKWWLGMSLAQLEKSLGGLLLLSGDPRVLLPDLARRTKASLVAWNRCYEPAAIARDKDVKARLLSDGVTARSFNGSLLHEPWEIETGAGGPFKVFTPFWRAARQRPVGPMLRTPRLKLARMPGGEKLSSWGLLPAKPNWAKGWDELWSPGEVGARKRLEHFVGNGLNGYGELRNRPDRPNVSRLSPHLHWGEISPRTVFWRAMHAAQAGEAPAREVDKFLSEIGWREFAYHLLYHYPTLPDQNWRRAFDAYPWRTSKADLAAWQRGLTGYPMVDAGMRELWATGYMHNRVRMVVASFLIKHLRIDWRQGEAWFWDTLCDADLANNAASWQWVAGSGADAAPYFRIFNPIEQGRKFDPAGAYVRRWCPELGRLPDEHLHAPFAAPHEVLAAAGVTLGISYPRPIVDHAAARKAALDGYLSVKAAGADPA